MKHCPKCGAEIADDRKDCGHHALVMIPEGADPIEYALGIAAAKETEAADAAAAKQREAKKARDHASDLQADADSARKDSRSAAAMTDKIKSLKGDQ